MRLLEDLWDKIVLQGVFPLIIAFGLISVVVKFVS